MLKILMLSVILSIDALSFGISYGANKIILPLKSAVIITVTGIGIIMGAMGIGNLMYSLLSWGKFSGGIILIGMGIFIAGDFRSRKGLKTILENPVKSDTNKNGRIEALEAVVIGTALSLDSSAVVAGTAYMGVMLPVMVMIMQIAFLIIGINLSKKIIPDVNSKWVAVVSGIVIVIIGFRQLC